MPNYVKKESISFNQTWTAPAGVTQVCVSIINKFNDLGKMAKSTNGYALRRSGQVYAWGFGTSGELGDGTTISKSSPVLVTGGLSFISIAAGNGHAIALRADGNAYVWGTGTNGQIGDSTLLSKSAPTLPSGGHSFIQVTAGFGNTGALKANGEAWTWGAASRGALGNNSTTTTSSPVPVAGGHSFIQFLLTDSFSIAQNSALALKANGEAWAWGSNQNDRLAINRLTDVSTPVQVIGGHSFIQIAVGADHFLALKNNGEAWAWGNNIDGQCGSFSALDISSPVQVVGGHSFIKIAAGTGVSAGLKSNGQVFTWGNNFNGGLGRNPGGSAITSPGVVVGGHSFVNVDCGNQRMIAVKDNGQIWTWGASGALGDNTTSPSRSSPVQIVGGLIYQPGSIVLLETTMSVTPGTTYNFNAYFSQINNQTIFSNSNGNNLVIMLEYTV